MSTLARVSEEHRQRLASHVERLSLLADAIGREPWARVSADLTTEHEFLVSTLVPHMQAVEEAVHAELDRLLSCRLGMAPLDREHIEIRRLIDRLGVLAAAAGEHEPSPGEAIELNRVLIKLHSILKVHLREEALYVPILEHNLTAAQAESIAAAMNHAARVEL
jgi:hypothetical protein